MTWLDRLNWYILRWTGFRLARIVNDDGRQIGWIFVGPKNPFVW